MNFTSYERWIHSSANGDFKYPKTMFDYMADVWKVIAKETENDHSGTFDVIQFLKDLRVAKPKANV